MKKIKLWAIVSFLLIPVLAWAIGYKGSTLESTGNTTVGGNLSVTGSADFVGTSHFSGTANFVGSVHTSLTASAMTLNGSTITAWPGGGGGDSAGILQNATDIEALALYLEEQHGIDTLLMEEGYKGSFQTSTNDVDTANSSGWTYDGTNKLYKNTPGGTGLTANVDFAAESQYVQQEWTKTNQAASFVSATHNSTQVSISSGSWPANSAASRITFDNGSNWYDVSSRDSSTLMTLSANYVGATATTLDWTMRMSEFSGGTATLNSTGSSSVDQSQLLGDNNVNWGDTASGRSKFGQSFTPGVSGDIVSVNVKIFKTGAPADNLQVAIYATSGGLPTGSALTSVETLAGTAVETSATVHTFTFASPATLTSGTVYAIALSRSGANEASNYYGIQNKATDAYAGGVALDYAAGVWETYSATQDAYFSTTMQTGTSVTNEYVSVAQAYANRIDTSAWSDINSLSRTETLNSQAIYYWLIDNSAASFGAGTTAKIWNATGGVWRNIARNNAGTWQYNDNSANDATETWVNATTNEFLFAVSQAISAQAANRMTGSQMAAIADANLTAPATSEIFGITLYSTNNAQNPAVDNIAVNYDASGSALDLRTKSFSVSTAPATLYAFVVDKQASGAPSYYVTRDGGAGSPTWSAIAMSSVINLTDGRTVRRGVLSMAGTPAGTDIRLKATVSAGASYEISGVGLQSRQ